jgi:antitoxin component of MazEF toxin-antitoxin module
MYSTILTSDYQVSIPEKLCQQLALTTGQRFTLLTKGNVIILVPTPSLASLRGLMKGANSENYRDRTDEE